MLMTSRSFRSSGALLARFVLAALLLFATARFAAAAETAGQIVAKAIIEDDSEKKATLITSLIGNPDPQIIPLFDAWKGDVIYLYKAEGSEVKIPVLVTGEKDADDKQAATRVDDGQPLKDAEGKPLKIVASDYDAAEHDSLIRGSMKEVRDLLALVAPDRDARVGAIR